MMKRWLDHYYELICLVAAAMLMLWLFAATRASAETCTTMQGIEPRYLTHQMDGDTISLFSIPYGNLKFRIQDVDTPERGETGWKEAGDFTWAWLQQGPFDLQTCWKRTLDRYEGVILRDGDTLARAIIEAGLTKEGAL